MWWKEVKSRRKLQSSKLLVHMSKTSTVCIKLLNGIKWFCNNMNNNRQEELNYAYSVVRRD